VNKPTRSIEWIVWGGLALVIATIFGAYVVSNLGRNHRPALPVLSQVSDFTLTNQLGRVMGLADLRGQVWVADIIYTRCPGPCVTLSRAMSSLQSAFSQTQTVKLVSLTADPEFDTPEVLRKYGEKFGARPERWQFLTGKKLELYRLATKGLLLAADEVKADERTHPEDLFVHSTLFVVVDKLGRVRGAFDGTEPSSQQKVLEATHMLLREDQP